CDGKMRFAKLIESENSNYAYGLAYNAGKVYITGTLFGSGKRIGYDISFATVNQGSFISQFDTSGQHKWTRFVDMEDPSSFYKSMSVSVAFDGQGNAHTFLSTSSGVKITPSLTTQAGSY